MLSNLAGALLLGAAQSLLVILVVVTLVFGVSRSTGDPITISVPQTATPQEIHDLKDAAGLNDPLYVQYVRFLGNAARLDLGTSFRTGQPALDEVTSRLPKTLELAVAAMLLAVLLGVSSGIVSAVMNGSVFDYTARLLALVGQATPSFWLGLVLIYFFAVRLGLLPTGGTGSWKHLVLPAFTLGAPTTAAIARLTRAAMLDVMQSDFIRTARAKGLGESTIVLRHALRHALLPVITIMGIQTGRMLAGAVIVETVFAWPGVGRLMINSITNADYPVVQAAVIFTSAFVVFANLLVDLAYRLVDPRIRVGLR